MLKANVGISRKLSKDFQSTGFTLNIEGEILATLDDAEAVIERVRELFGVAEEALDRQIAESRSIDAMASRDADDLSAHSSNGKTPARVPEESNGHSPRNGHRAGPPSGGEPASNKQVQFLTTLAKRQKLFGAKLESFIEDVLGRRCSPYDLTKKEAGTVIDALNPETSDDSRSHR